MGGRGEVLWLGYGEIGIRKLPRGALQFCPILHELVHFLNENFEERSVCHYLVDL